MKTKNAKLLLLFTAMFATTIFLLTACNGGGGNNEAAGNCIETFRKCSEEVATAKMKAFDDYKKCLDNCKAAKDKGREDCFANRVNRADPEKMKACLGEVEKAHDECCKKCEDAYTAEIKAQDEKFQNCLNAVIECLKK